MRMGQNQTVKTIRTDICGEELILYPEKAVMHERDLLLADLHLGKIRHFRKLGHATTVYPLQNLLAAKRLFP